eukprot:04898_5
MPAEIHEFLVRSAGASLTTIRTGCLEAVIVFATTESRISSVCPSLPHLSMRVRLTHAPALFRLVHCGPLETAQPVESIPSMCSPTVTTWTPMLAASRKDDSTLPWTSSHTWPIPLRHQAWAMTGARRCLTSRSATTEMTRSVQHNPSPLMAFLKRWSFILCPTQSRPTMLTRGLFSRWWTSLATACPTPQRWSRSLWRVPAALWATILLLV